ncbi:MAG TPA: hypothetical protein VGO47_00765, partial [Chlamydiales bacterium]|nr:hypothetical protein [Chlamydiales bacterium]
MPTTTPKVLDTDAASPSIPRIRVTTQYAGPKLDKLKGNYKKWLIAIELFLTLAGFNHYVKGTIAKPGLNEPRARTNWEDNDELATALITSTLEEHEMEYVDRGKGAKICFTEIKARHKSEGPIRQVQLLQEALTMICTHETPLPTTAELICAKIDRAYEMGEITKDLFKCIALLGALRDYTHLRSIITRDLSMATVEVPFTSTQLRTYLDQEQNMLNADNKPTGQGSSMALVTRSQPPQIICTNCKRNRHTAEYCIASGGGMAGKTIEESRQARRNKDSRRGRPAAPGTINSTQGKFQIKVSGTDGKAYFLNVDPSMMGAFTPTQMETQTAPSEGQMSPSDSIPTDLQANFCDPDAIEYEGWMAIEQEFITSVNWDNNSQPTNKILNASEIVPLSQKSKTIISITIGPFWLDTGASIHISPNKDDFITLRRIKPRPVGGLTAMSVIAIGIGDIKIRVGRGAYILLKDVFFIPDSKVRLISVRCLTRDHSAVAHFDESRCWLTHKSTGNVLARGSLLPNKNLYALNLSSAQAEHALISTHLPNIETWHRRLGHANYQAISDMARNNLITGANLNSPQKTTKCDACILGKQTKTPVPKLRQTGEGHRATKRLEKVWVDLAGPTDVKSKSGNLYIMN